MKHGWILWNAGALVLATLALAVPSTMAFESCQRDVHSNPSDPEAGYHYKDCLITTEEGGIVCIGYSEKHEWTPDGGNYNSESGTCATFKAISSS